MSEKAELTAPFYKILSVFDEGEPVGIDDLPSTWKLVRIDGDLDIVVWKFKEVERGVFRLSPRESDTYTGEAKDKSVIVTTDKEDDKEWRVNFWKENETFSIELNTAETWCAPAWTSFQKEIVLKPFTGNSRNQVFKIVPILM